MFTGIIEEIGIIASIIRAAQSGRLTLSASKSFAALKTGESIAVNGVCLTVTNVRRNFVEFDLSAETFRKTNFQDLKVGDKVNLEKALLMANRLGGHLVMGHVDGVGEIKKKINLGAGFELHLSVPSELLRYMVPKGSIALDGISLTITDLRDELSVVSVIPHTAKTTTLGEKRIGDRVNLEVDILSKYIEKHLRGEVSKGINDDMLARVGFLPMGWIEN
ncbi:riboflavin synthase subunit alpha [candidate division WOR-1 bacterium RIFCSPLOWO2_02_FULL_46_20]|uniref:Riboflavin synthase n=2 Tax=Saganbacteria TaxID=1703751 RepID=A0A1F4R8N7_UNCSA|nr:MAG: riboflavin synthase subunit alpha [candidate division WOR-1 bacterium RIFCSPHIGHO2_02_FULL_45_12]OGC04520.1 MAG: riboflavin synthase subunit alpha [candidate division WOR-1 bacterium RIFCSPLOWO2_02_FULL_46_20]OGC09336.1 MAG: riboflavin synthase subunit alpha [candidate division WOR-1 bacterium RIFCSPLOWO2_12_FULL_45_9]